MGDDGNATVAPSPPTTPALRIGSIDVLRGFALLGILVMNVQSFSMVDAAYFLPTAYGDFTGANYAVWLAGHLLADQKMMTVFAMLFGAGVVLMSSARERSGGSPAAAHYRRMAVLLLIGLAHAYLLWYGDILVAYALCGMAVYPLRRLRPAVLLPLGMLIVSVASAISLASGWSVRFWPEEEVRAFAADFSPTPEQVADELATYRGGWLRQMDHRAPTSFYFETVIFALWGFWRAAGLMLVGMGLFKLGVFSAERSRRFYTTLLVVGAALGLPLGALGVHRMHASGWDPVYVFFNGSQYNYWGSIPVALAWVAAVMLVCKSGAAVAAITGPLAAVGRLALSNYLLQTLICTTIFYGHGLGLFGRVERTGQAAIVVGVWAVQLVLSPLYLRHFRIGPAEWLWRLLTYLRPPALRRELTA